MIITLQIAGIGLGDVATGEPFEALGGCRIAVVEVVPQGAAALL